MNLNVLAITDELNRADHHIVIDLYNYRLPFASINNFLISKRKTSINRLKSYSYGLSNYFQRLHLNNLNYLTVTENQVIIYIDFLESEPVRNNQ